MHLVWNTVTTNISENPHYVFFYGKSDTHMEMVYTVPTGLEKKNAYLTSLLGMQSDIISKQLFHTCCKMIKSHSHIIHMHTAYGLMGKDGRCHALVMVGRQISLFVME